MDQTFSFHVVCLDGLKVVEREGFMVCVPLSCSVGDQIQISKSATHSTKSCCVYEAWGNYDASVNLFFTNVNVVLT